MYQVSHEKLRRIATQIPQSEKREYLVRLSEDDFRDKVVRPLFKCLGFTDGRDTCGPAEMGRDAYFTADHPLSGTDITVVQTKRGKITKSSKPSENLDTIVTQLRTALATPVALLKRKQKKLPLRAFLVVSGEIKPAAIEYIVDQLSDSRIEFLDSEQIVPLVDEKMPELWLNIASELLPYFRSVATALEEGYDIIPGGLNVAAGSKQVATADDVFADVYVFRPTRPRLANARKPKKGALPKLDYIRITTIVDAPERRVLLVGEGGSGKSTALKRILYELAIKPIDGPENVRVPILLRAKDIAANVESSLIDHADVAVTRLGSTLKLPFTADDLEAGRVIFMVDGLDEVTDDDLASKVIELLNRHHDAYPKGQIIVTTRDSSVVQKNSVFSGYANFRLASLIGTQIVKLVTGYAKRHSLGVDDSNEILRRLREINGVELSPLIVTIFVATSDATRSDIPANITELFSKYTELMLGRWDESKGLYQQIQAPIKAFILKQIAFRMHERRATSITLTEFRSILNTELASRGFSDASATIYDEIVTRSGLFRVAEEFVEFKHLILQEYFAGQAIPSADYILAVCDDLWWRSAIVFYFGANPGDATSLKRLADLIESKTGEDRLVAATALGLALQACYLSQIDEKRAVYEKLLLSLVELRGDAHIYGGRYDNVPIIKTNMMMFLVRDALSLSTLKLFEGELHESNQARFRDDPVSLVEVQYWQICGLIQSGQYGAALRYLEEDRSFSAHHILAILIQSALIAATRISSDGTEKELGKLIQAVVSRIGTKYPRVFDDLRSEGRSLQSAGTLLALPSQAGLGDPNGDDECDINEDQPTSADGDL